MIIAAHQPNYLPNLAFFNKMKLVDLFLIISNIQFEKQEGWQQRHRIKGPNGDVWLTVPILGSQNQLIKDVMINNQIDWRKKHSRTLEMTYAKSKGKGFIPQVTALYKKDWKRMIDLNIAFILLLRDIFQIKTPVKIDENVSGVKHTLLINVCKKHKAVEYLSGVGSRFYLDKTMLEEIHAQDINHKVVEKDLTALYPYSAIHYLLSEGNEWVRNVI